MQRLSWSVVTTAWVIGGCTAPGGADQPMVGQENMVINVGIAQRFGTKATDTLVLQARSGDRLTLQLDSQAQAMSATTAKVEVMMQPLATPRTEERVVLSTHRSFESAEDDALRWEAQGIQVEVGQPERWQVWAKRDIYPDPMVRRMLLDSIKAKGIQTAFIDTKVIKQEPRPMVVVNGQRYPADRVTITTGTDRTYVNANTHKEQFKRLYAGTLRIQPNTYGTFTLVNQVPVETYLRGVVPHEIGTETTPSVLEVQAILARTYALRNLRRFKIDDYQLCADTQCQVYYGLTGTAANTDRAIANTANLVLTYNNELVDAVYSSTTGGVTAAFNDAWDGPERPYLRSVIDSVNPPWDLASRPLNVEANLRQFIAQRRGFNEETGPWFRWREASSIAQLNKNLREFLTKRKHPLSSFTTIQALEVTQRSLGGRVLKLKVTTDIGEVELGKDNVLVAFEAPNSMLFYLDPIVDAQKVLKGYTFVGGGLGHGVGLSQTGSYHLGHIGWTSDRILSFYFPGTQLQPMSQAITLWRHP